jgi:membrane protease YdiL (CAAX protease family)
MNFNKLKHNNNVYYENKFGKKDFLTIGLIPILTVSIFIIAALITLARIKSSGMELNEENIQNATMKSVDIVANVSLIGLFGIIFKDEYRKYYADFKRNYKKMIIIIIAFLIIDFSINLILNLIPASKIETQNNVLIKESYSNQSIIVTILSIAILTPIFEELLFRQILMNHISNRFKLVFGILFSQTIFAMLHVQQQFGTQSYFTEFLIYFLGSIMLPISYHYSKNIFVPIVLHMISNLVAVLIMFG